MSLPPSRGNYLAPAYTQKVRGSERPQLYLNQSQYESNRGSAYAASESGKKTIFGQPIDAQRGTSTDSFQFDQNLNRPPSRSLTPNYPKTTTNVGTRPELFQRNDRQSNTDFFQNPLALRQQQQRNLFSQPPDSPGYPDPYVPRRISTNKSVQGLSVGLGSELYVPRPQETLTVKPSLSPTQPFIRDSTFSSVPRSPTNKDGISNRPSTVVKVDPFAKAMNPQGQLPFFAEKRVIVTGASSGIGRAVAMWFLNSGAKVALIGRDLDSLVNVGKQFPNQALVIKCDLSKDDQPYDMFNTVMTEFNGIDILVNAAGVIREGDIKTVSPQDFDFTMDVNLRSMFYLSYLFFPALQKSRGTIINISCQYGTKAFAGLYAYCMSKAGVESLTKHMAYEFASSGVRVNAVAPGLVETNLLVYRKVPEDDIKQIYANAEKYTPLKRVASIDDVGKAIIFLCSEAAAHITGQILKVDGGRHLTSSGWHQWEGKRATNLMMESKESVIQSLKGKLIASTNIMVGYTIKERIEAQLKFSSWSTSEQDAHAAVKFANYQQQDVRNDPRVSVMAMENTFQKIFPMK